MYYYLIFGIALLASGCVTTEGGGLEFAPCEAVANAVEALGSVPDDTKATALEGLAWLLSFTGAGAIAVPLLSKVANYYRNRADNKKQTDVETISQDDSDIYS